MASDSYRGIRDLRARGFGWASLRTQRQPMTAQRDEVWMHTTWNCRHDFHEYCTDDADGNPCECDCHASARIVVGNDKPDANQ